MDDSADKKTARKIYANLRKGISSAVDWRLCDELNVSADALDRAVEASGGHLYWDTYRILRVRILRVKEMPK